MANGILALYVYCTLATLNKMEYIGTIVVIELT